MKKDEEDPKPAEKVANAETPNSNAPVKDLHTETKGEALARLEGESEPLQPGHLAARQALRLARYKDDGTVLADYTLTRATVLAFARTMQAIVDAETTRHRQDIADGALDEIDRMVYPEPAPRLGKPAPKK